MTSKYSTTSDLLVRASPISEVSGIRGLTSACGSVFLELRECVAFEVISVSQEHFADVLQMAARHVGVEAPSGLRFALSGDNGSLLHIEPLKLALVDSMPITLTSELGHSLDQSHSNVVIQVRGERSDSFLNCHLGLDLRAVYFPEDTVASTTIHGVSLYAWRLRGGFDLLVPRTFSRSLWEVFSESLEFFSVANDPYSVHESQ